KERLRLGRPDAAERVPVRAPGWERQRPARRGADQAPFRIEGVEQREEVELVGAPPVEEHECALRRSGGGSDPRSETHRPIVTVAPSPSTRFPTSPASPPP